jgi:hypothetical protein
MSRYPVLDYHGAAEQPAEADVGDSAPFGGWGVAQRAFWFRKVLAARPTQLSRGVRR